jgi:hypothetical protein
LMISGLAGAEKKSVGRIIAPLASQRAGRK